MLTTFFRWADSHPAFYWAGALAASLLLVRACAPTLAKNASSPGPSSSRDWGFGLLLLVFLFAWRWPYLLYAGEYNPDESQFIAGALTLRHDPVFWRAVDGNTTGPLNVYALLPLHLLGLPLDYFSARLTALLLAWGTLLGLGQFFRALSAPSARIAILPVAVFFATNTDVDFVHYSSELVPLACLAFAVACLPRHSLTAAFVAGWLPWTKTQAIPLGAAFVGWQLVLAWRETGRREIPWRRASALIGCAALPSLLVLSSIAASGQCEHFYRRYILQNLEYVAEGNGLGVLMSDLWRRSQHSGHFPAWCAASLLLILWFGANHLARRLAPSRFFWLGVALTIAALVCIFVPARPSLHYFLFLAVPVAVWTGAALSDLWRQVDLRRVLTAVTLACALFPLAWRVGQPAPEMLGQFAENWRQPYTPLGSVLRYWSAPGVRLTVWGWLSSAHVESGLPQGARDTLSVWSIQPTPQRAYHRATYLEDMRRNRPELFVDSVGPGSPFLNDRATEAHEILPELADFIRENYRLVIDLRPARVYVRTDFLATHPIDLLTLQRLVARGRPAYENPTAPEHVSPAAAPKNQVDGHEVQMVEPGTELSWLLVGTERKVRLDFGFHPKAWSEGRTDGAEFIAELRMPGQPALPVYSRLLRPIQQAGDRAPLTAEVILPPFPAGTRLVVRSATGPAGDGAWDWVYFHHAWFSHSPFYSAQQFPGFRRVPDRLDEAYPSIADDPAGRRLMLPPPAAVTFVLAGPERHLGFTFGLQEGAYTGSGQTDGITCQVELQRDGSAPRLVYDRRLNPLAEAGDRGPQHGDLVLPDDARAGDRIVLRLEAGGNSSWDWSYLSAFDLR